MIASHQLFHNIHAGDRRLDSWRRSHQLQTEGGGRRRSGGWLGLSTALISGLLFEHLYGNMGRGILHYTG